MNATAYWVTGAAAGAEDVSTAKHLEQVILLAIPSGAGRIDVTRTGKLSAAVIAPGGSDRVAIELYAGDRRSMLRTGIRRATKCCFGGSDRRFTSDAAWTPFDAAEVALSWLREGSVRSTNPAVGQASIHRILSPGDADEQAHKRERMYEGVERFRRLRGRCLDADLDLHAFLLGVIGIAGATGLHLADVVERSAARGRNADAARWFALSIDTNHGIAHGLADQTQRRAWLIERANAALDSVGIRTRGEELARRLYRYLECEIGRQRIPAR